MAKDNHDLYFHTPHHNALDHSYKKPERTVLFIEVITAHIQSYHSDQYNPSSFTTHYTSLMNNIVTFDDAVIKTASAPIPAVTSSTYLIGSMPLPD